MLNLGLHNPYHEYTLNNVPIAAVDSMKDLGIYISYDLSWQTHITLMLKRAYIICYTILHSFYSHNIDLYMRAFDSYVKSIVEYSCYVWFPMQSKYIDAIENIKSLSLVVFL